MNCMIIKIIIGILIIGFSLGIIDSAEGFIEIKKYKVTNSPNVCGDKLCSEIDEKICKERRVITQHQGLWRQIMF